MRPLIHAAIAALVLCTGVASAQTIQNAFGNTVIVTSAGGASTRYHFNEDGTFTGVAPGGSQMAGRWAIEGDQLCLIPPSGRAPTCTAIAADKNVGDTWTQPGSDGSDITVTIEAGRTSPMY